MISHSIETRTSGLSAACSTVMSGRRLWAVSLAMLAVALGAPVNPARGEPASFTHNGEPFFPIMLYSYEKEGDLYGFDHLPELAGTGFNVVRASCRWRGGVSREQLDRCHRHGVNILLDAYVWFWDSKRYAEDITKWIKNVGGNHPAFFAYEAFDEPELRGVKPQNQHFPKASIADSLAGKAFVTALDSKHAILCNFADILQTENNPDFVCEPGPLCTIEGYRQWTSIATVFTMDIYPVGHPFHRVTRKLNAASAGFDKLKQIVNNDKIPQGFILQSCAWNEMGGSCEGCDVRPTFEDTRFMVFDVITQGAKCIEWYGVARIKDPAKQAWQDIKKCAYQLAVLQDILAGGKTLGTADYMVPGPLHALCKQYPADTGPKYLIVTNPSEKEQSHVEMSLKGCSSTVRVMFEDGRTLPVNDGRFADRFDVWGVHIYTTDECDWRPPRPRNATADQPTIAAGASITLRASTIEGAEIHWYSNDAPRQRLHIGNAFAVSPAKTTTYQAWAAVKGTDCRNLGSTGDRVTVTVK